MKKLKYIFLLAGALSLGHPANRGWMKTRNIR